MISRRLWLLVAGALTTALVACGGVAEAPPRTPMLDASAITPAAQWSFDTAPVGAPPPAAEPFTGAWAVRAEADAPSGSTALSQTGNADFPPIMLSPKPLADVVVTARFKPISGSVD